MPYNKLIYIIKFILNRQNVNIIRKDQTTKKGYDNLKL
jgi:hypothetical protein